MQIFVKNFDGKTLTVDVDYDTTVLELKQHLSYLTGIPAKIIRLIFASKQLEDIRKLGDYNIMSESNLHILFRLLSGGMVFVKFKNIIIPVPIILNGLKIVSTPYNIIDKIYNMNEYKYVFKDICSDCLSNFSLSLRINNERYFSKKLDNYVSLHNYGIYATSIPNKKYLLNLKILENIQYCKTSISKS